MDERVGVNELDRSRCREDALGLEPNRAGRCEAENGPHTLAARQQGVAHGLRKAGSRFGVAELETFEIRIDELAQPVRIVAHAVTPRPRMPRGPRGRARST